MASMSPDMAQDERLLDQLAKITKNPENPKAETIEADGFYSKTAIQALDAIPTTRHERDGLQLSLVNGYQKTFTRFRKSMLAKVEKFRKKDDDEIDDLPFQDEMLKN